MYPLDNINKIVRLNPGIEILLKSIKRDLVKIIAIKKDTTGYTCVFEGTNGLNSEIHDLLLPVEVLYYPSVIYLNKGVKNHE